MSSVNNDDGSKVVIEKPFVHQPEDGVISGKDLKIAFFEFYANVLNPKLEKFEEKIDIKLEKLEEKINTKMEKRFDRLYWILGISFPTVIATIVGAVWYLAEKILK